MAGGHVDDAETKSWASQTGRPKAEDAASRSRNQEEGVAGGHVDDAETKSWASQTGRPY